MMKPYTIANPLSTLRFWTSKTIWSASRGGLPGQSKPTQKSTNSTLSVLQELGELQQMAQSEFLCRLLKNWKRREMKFTEFSAWIAFHFSICCFALHKHTLHGKHTFYANLDRRKKKYIEIVDFYLLLNFAASPFYTYWQQHHVEQQLYHS